MEEIVCDLCWGTGKVQHLDYGPNEQCPKCFGSGYIEADEAINDDN